MNKRIMNRFPGKRPLLVAIAAVAIYGCDRQPKSADDFLQSGVAFYEQGRLDRAGVQFRNAIAKQSDFPKPYYYMGLIAKEEQDHRGVLYYMRKAVEYDPSSVSAQAELGEIAVLTGDLEAAQVAVQTILSAEPNHERGQVLELAVLVAKQEWQLAASKVQSALELFPDNAELWGLSAVVKKTAGEFSGALVDLDRAIALADDDIQYHLLRLEINQQKNDMEGLVADFRALAKKSENPTPYIVRLTQLISESQGPSDAEATLKGYITVYPADYALQTLHVQMLQAIDSQAAGEALHNYITRAESPTALLFYRVSVALEKGHVDIAQADLQQIISLPGDDADVLAEATALLAEINWARGQVDQAEQYASDVLAQDGNHERALLLLAKINFHKGRADEGAAQLNRVLSRNQDSEIALHMMAQYYQMQGSSRRAGEIYQRLLQKNPAHKPALMHQISQALSRGFNDSAEALLQRALALHGPDLELLALQVQISVLRKNWTGAEEALQKMAANGLAKSELYYLTGYVKRQQGDCSKAIDLYRQAVVEGGIHDSALKDWYDCSRSTAERERLALFLDEQLDRYPQDLTAHLLKADYLAGHSTLQVATDYMRQTVKENSNWFAGHMTLANLLRSQGELTSALEALNAAYAIDATAGAGVIIAGVHEQLGDYEQAEAAYAQVLERYPEHTAARNNYASLLSGDLYSKENVAKAILLSQAFSTSDNPALLDTYGYALFRAGKLNQAERILRRAERHSDNATIRYHFALVLQASGDEEGAQRMFDRAATGARDNPDLLQRIENARSED